MDKPNFKGESCLHICAKMNFPKTAEVLLNAAAKIDICSSTHVTPLHEAARCGNFEILDVLINYGADVNARTKVNSERFVVVVYDDDDNNNSGDACGDHDDRVETLLFTSQLQTTMRNVRLGY